METGDEFQKVIDHANHPSVEPEPTLYEICVAIRELYDLIRKEGK